MAERAKWRLKLFGRPSLRDADGRAIDLPKKAFVIAAHLVLDRPKMERSRNELAEFLWSDSDSLRRQTSLRTLLKRIRVAFTGVEEPPILIDDESVALDGINLSCDVLEATRLLARGAPQDVVDASALISGELIENCESGSTAFENWLSQQRSSLSQAFLSAGLRSLESPNSEAAGAWKEPLAQKLISENPMEEAGYRALLKLYASQRNFEGVRATYDRLARGLRTELGCQPSAETRSLFSSLVAEGDIGRADVSTRTALIGKAFGASIATILPSNAQRPLLIVPSCPAGETDRSMSAFVALVDDLLVQLWKPRSLRIAVGPAGDTSIAAEIENGSEDVYRLHLGLKSADCPRLSARLTHTPASDLLWAETFLLTSDRYDDVIARTADAIIFKIEDHQIELSNDRPFEKKTSFTLVAQAERALMNADLPSIRRARRWLRAAVQNNSNSPRAQAGLARTFRIEWLLRAGQDATLLANARGIARAALDTYPDSHIAHHELGATALYQGEYGLALEHLNRARALQPFDNSLLYDLADALIADGQAKEGVKLIQTASPSEFRSAEFRHWIAASGLYNLGEYRSAIAELSHMQNPYRRFDCARPVKACSAKKIWRNISERSRLKNSRTLNWKSGYRAHQ
jgi:DNA-binding SARP family transcriptional activator